MPRWGFGVGVLPASKLNMNAVLREAQEVAHAVSDDASAELLARVFRPVRGSRRRECVCGERVENNVTAKADHAKACDTLRRLKRLAQTAHERKRRER